MNVNSSPGEKCCDGLKSVAVLMGTCNGEDYISEQLESIASQSYSIRSLLVSDDGSTDHTLDLVHEFKYNHPELDLRIIKGPRKGFAANYMRMLSEIGPEYDFYAFCDQDDIWSDEKIAVSVDKIMEYPDYKDRPILYGARTEIIDNNGHSIGYSPLFRKEPSFENALVQNISGGNTMMMNSLLRNFILMVQDHESVVSHDWLSYMVVTAVGGRFVYDSNCNVKYRQHSNNRVGSNLGWSARVKRFWQVFAKKRFQQWHSRNLKCLAYIKSDITSDNREILNKFMYCRGHGHVRAVKSIRKVGLYRQTNLETLSLYMAAFLKRI